MQVNKKLRQGTGEQNKMRSSNYEKMKQTAEGKSYVSSVVVNTGSKKGAVKKELTNVSMNMKQLPYSETPQNQTRS